ncbi:MAG TPA: hypothetical protein VFB96_19020 [Pirellulaceae bacterium]|nr:hypothetical protein [Pirellulaceae bacterium]
MAWVPIESGTTVGQAGSENGVVLRDEEHELGARITLERDTVNAPFAITCGIYGWMFHTRYFGGEIEAVEAFERMKDSLGAILGTIPSVDDPHVDVKSRQVCEAISSFVERFP